MFCYGTSCIDLDDIIKDDGQEIEYVYYKNGTTCSLVWEKKKGNDFCGFFHTSNEAGKGRYWWWSNNINASYQSEEYGPSYLSILQGCIAVKVPTICGSHLNNDQFNSDVEDLLFCVKNNNTSKITIQPYVYMCYTPHYFVCTDEGLSSELNRQETFTSTCYLSEPIQILANETKECPYSYLTCYFYEDVTGDAESETHDYYTNYCYPDINYKVCIKQTTTFETISHYLIDCSDYYKEFGYEIQKLGYKFKAIECYYGGSLHLWF